MNRISLIILLLLSLLTSCSKLSGKLSEPKVESDLQKQSEPFSVSPDLLRGKPIRDFVTIVFKAGFDRNRWKEIFEKTKGLSSIRNQIIALDDRLADLSTDQGFQLDPKTCIEYGKTEMTRFESKDDLVSCLSDSKLGLFAEMGLFVEDIRQNDAALLMVLDESLNCEFSKSDPVIHTCSVDDVTAQTDLRIAGNPIVVSPWNIHYPTARDIWIYPGLQATIESTRFYPGHFKMKFRLRAEQAFKHTLKFVGDVEVDRDSILMLQGVKTEFDPFGYSELTISK